MAFWLKYKGFCDKRFYDIRLHNGEVYLNCWPNAGTFHTQGGLCILGGEVDVIKKSKGDK